MADKKTSKRKDSEPSDYCPKEVRDKFKADAKKKSKVSKKK